MSESSMQERVGEGESGGSGLEAAEREAVGSVLFGGMARPGRHLVLDGGERTGPAYFFTAFTLYCLAPMILLNLTIVLIERSMPSAIRFHDINPNTILIALPAQLLIGPLVIGILATCMRLGLTIAGLVPESASGRLQTTSWYVGTLLVCMYGWWLGILVALASVRAIEPALEWGVPVITVLQVVVLVRVMLVAYHRNSPAVSGAKWGRVVGGLVFGTVLYIIAMILVGFILQVALLAVLER